MMKKIKIYHSNYGDENVKISESSAIGIDLSALIDFYDKMGEKHRRSVERFLDYWNNGGCEKLFVPKAVVKVLPLETAVDNFGKDNLLLNDSVDRVAIAVWSIGPELEKEASALMSSAGDVMTGLLLDVAGSIALYDMHKELILWIKNNAAAVENKFINGEFHPGMGSMRQDLIEKVVNLGDTENVIGVRACGDSLMNPRKSQCSFIALGASEHEVEIKMEPCVPCAGKKCLYYQLGGCHMMTG